MALFALAGVCLFAGCQSDGLDYEHNRFDYWEFRARAGRLPEPNYLPWALHVETLPEGGRALLACRWPNSAFPLRYYVDAPQIPEEIQDEFSPRDPLEYVGAVARAFELWEQAVGRPVRFERVDRAQDAQLVVRLEASEMRVSEGHVLGIVRDEAGRCRVTGASPEIDQVAVEYEVGEVQLYVSDAVGLLTPHQVHAIALHEIGHVLGVSGQHSPLRGDVMYPVAADRRVDVLSQHDMNTLRSLYSLVPGSIYARLDETRKLPMAEVRRGPPRLGGELSDERFGLRVRFPRGWQVIRSSRGWIAVDGLSWDYDASIQVVASRGVFDADEATRNLGRLTSGEVESAEVIELDGQPVARVIARGSDRTEEVSLIGWDEDWLVFVIADCRSEDYQLYQPWFRSVLFSLDHPNGLANTESKGSAAYGPE